MSSLRFRITFGGFKDPVPLVYSLDLGIWLSGTWWNQPTPGPSASSLGFRV